jgi:hypothetical protein
MNRKVRFVLTLLALFAVVPSLSGHDSKDKRGVEPKKVSELMRKKLEYAQKVLEGIALNDFNKIAEQAGELIEVSKATEWRVVKTPQYEVHSNQFRRAVEGLIEKAKEKNVDGAALSYVELTMSCVKCHKHVREVRMTRLDREPERIARLPVALP